MNKPSRVFAKPLRELVGKIVGEAFTRQGFASAELVTRWAEIVGTEIAVHSEPIKIQWSRGTDPQIRSSGNAGTACRRAGGNRNPAPGRRDLRTGELFLRLARR